MKHIITYCLIGVLFFLSSCQKNKLPEVQESGSPVFFVKCMVNGVPLNLQAGTNNYVMNSSYYQDKNKLYIYKSELKQNCTTNGSCGYEFAILINDSKYPDSVNGTMNAEKALVPGNYTFGTGNTDPLYYTGTFTSLNGQPGNHTWLFGDTTITGESVSKRFIANKTYTVSLSSICNASSQKVFKIGNPLQTNITAVNISGTKYSFSAAADTKGPYSYEWGFGDGSFSVDPNPEHSYSSSQVQYIATLKLTDGDKNTCNANYIIVPTGSCNANFISSFAPVPNTSVLSNITLLIKDPNGLVYSSNDIQQLSDSKFQIISVEEYSANENGDKTKKIKINFSCKVKDGNDVISITNGEAVIAAAYK